MGQFALLRLQALSSDVGRRAFPTRWSVRQATEVGRVCGRTYFGYGLVVREIPRLVTPILALVVI